MARRIGNPAIIDVLDLLGISWEDVPSKTRHVIQATTATGEEVQIEISDDGRSVVCIRD